MRSPIAGVPAELIALLDRQPDHREVERALTEAGWTACGAGDWAIALRAPDGTLAARISPFDPTGPYTAALYRQAAPTRQVPRLIAHARLAGGGDLQIMEWLHPVPEAEAIALHLAIAARSAEVADLVDAIQQIHDQARRELPWCGPLDQNPANVMRTTDGRLVVADLFYADGPNLYETATTNPDLVVARIPASERRFMTEIPLAVSGPWEPGAQDAMRAALAAADARKTPRPHAARPERLERDPDRVAFLIPGHGYSTERPLLHFARAVFLKHGWTTHEVWWPERPPQRDGQELRPWFDQLRSFALTHMSDILNAEAAPKIALVGKSMGTFAAALAADRSLPGIWLTPVLRDSELPNDLRRSTAPFLLAGSTADPSWDGNVARSLGHPFYEATGANHSMETDDDPLNSAEILKQTTIAMDDFVTRL